MTWHWVSICDLDMPDGQKLIGVAIMSDPSKRPAWADILDGRNVEVAAFAIPSRFGDPPDEWREQLLTDKERIATLTEQWHGGPVMTLGEWEEQQLS